MIYHSYAKPADNLAQHIADALGRQEVTLDWYINHANGHTLYKWTCDADFKMNLDPWRTNPDLDHVKDTNSRIFMDKVTANSIMRELSINEALKLAGKK